MIADEASLSTLRSHTGLLSRAWGWLQARQVVRSSTRRLRVAETVSLGEKRFVAVVQVDGRHFLLAGGPTNIVLLAQLDTKEAFGDVLKKTLTAPRKQVAKRKQPANFSTQEQVNRTNSHEDVPQKTATAGGKQRAKPAAKQTAFEQGRPNGPLTNHLNGTNNSATRCGRRCLPAASRGIMSGSRIPNRKQNRRGTSREEHLIAPAMLCVMLCLGATSSDAMATPVRAVSGAGLGVVLSPSLPMLLAAGPIQLGAEPSNPNELRITGLGGVDAVDRRHHDDFPDPHSFHAHLHDAIRKATDCLSFPQAGAGPADDAIEPDPYWLVGDHDLLPHAAGG